MKTLIALLLVAAFAAPIAGCQRLEPAEPGPFGAPRR